MVLDAKADGNFGVFLPYVLIHTFLASTQNIPAYSYFQIYFLDPCSYA